MKSVFAYDGYRPFLRDCFPSAGEARGQRQALARELGCQTSFLSQVLTERSHMSEEMLLATCSFLRLNHDELDFVLLLHRYERAGSAALTAHYEKKIEVVRREQSQVETALANQENLSGDEQTRYYSTWLYSAIYIATMLKSEMTLASLSRLLIVSEAEVSRAAEFLVEVGLVRKNGLTFETGSRRVHLQRSSPLAVAAHSTWRIESLRHIQKQAQTNLHFSAVYTLSKKDFGKIRKMLEEQILACEKVIAPSKEEEICALNIDLFRYGEP